MTDHANELRRHARKIPHPQGETPGVMLRAADEIERLRAKIAEMEQQEPIGWLLDGDFYEVRQMSLYKDNEPLPGQTALYALPGAQPELNLSDPAVQKRLAAQWGYVPAGAQPAPSVPDGWKLVPIVSTHEMDYAGSEHYDGYLSTAQVVWDAMLAAAPEANQ